MASTSSDSAPSERALTAARARIQRHDAIRAGLLPTNDDLVSGAPFFREDIVSDIQVWAADVLLRDDLTPTIRRRVTQARNTGSIQAVESVSRAVVDRPEMHLRCRIYLSFLGDAPSREWLVFTLLSRYFRGPRDDGFNRIAIAIGLGGHGHQVGRVSMHAVWHDGQRYLTDAAARMTDAVSAIAATIAGQADDPLQAVLEDRSESVGADSDDEDDDFDLLAELTGPTLVVLRDMPVQAGTKERRANREAFRQMTALAMPLVTRGDVGAHRRALVGRSPHLAPVYDILLGDLAVREAIRFRPTILVSPPGFGKSSLARDICAQLDIPFTVYSAGGVADGTLGGTAAHWSTSGPSVPLDLIRTSGVANPCVIIDEIDKASLSRHNGSLVDALLGFLDRGNAGAMRDPSIEATVDLSAVNWLLTANSVSDIPAPLKDRCRIVVVPVPGWEHVGDLVKTIVDDIATERELDRRWFDPLAPDELELVRQTWTTGSLRQLRAIVETLIDGRSAIYGRA